MTRSRLLLLLFRLVTVPYAVLLTTQPVWIGLFLEGSFDHLQVHRTVGGIAIGVTWLVLVAAALVWWPGRVSWRPFAAAVGLLAALVAQFALGSQRLTGVHIPLGVLLVVAAAGLAAWGLLPSTATKVAAR